MHQTANVLEESFVERRLDRIAFGVTDKLEPDFYRPPAHVVAAAKAARVAARPWLSLPSESEVQAKRHRIKGKVSMFLYVFGCVQKSRLFFLKQKSSFKLMNCIKMQDFDAAPSRLAPLSSVSKLQYVVKCHIEQERKSKACLLS